MVRIKICGNRTVEDISAAVNAGADAIGLIAGVRHRSEDALEPQRAADLLRSMPVFVSSVLVTHLVTAEQVLQLHKAIPTSTIQLHDEIPVEEIRAIRQAIPYVPLIKAVGVVDETAIATAQSFETDVDAILLDTHITDRIGGTGIVHNWSISRRIAAAVRKPIILAGGLRPQNVSRAIEVVRPYGVDVNSGVEYPNGDKDPVRTRDFVRIAKDYSFRLPPE